MLARDGARVLRAECPPTARPAAGPPKPDVVDVSRCMRLELHRAANTGYRRRACDGPRRPSSAIREDAPSVRFDHGTLTSQALAVQARLGVAGSLPPPGRGSNLAGILGQLDSCCGHWRMRRLARHAELGVATRRGRPTPGYAPRCGWRRMPATPARLGDRGLRGYWPSGGPPLRGPHHARKASVLRRYFDLARRTGLIRRRPHAGLARREGGRGYPGAQGRPSIQTLIDSRPCRRRRRPDARDLAIVELLYGTPAGSAAVRPASRRPRPLPPRGAGVGKGRQARLCR